MFGIEIELRAAILKHKAQCAAFRRVGIAVIRDQSRSHAAIVGLYQADHHPVLVSDSHINGVGGDAVQRCGRHIRLRRFGHINGLTVQRRAAFRQ